MRVHQLLSLSFPIPKNYSRSHTIIDRDANGPIASSTDCHMSSSEKRFGGRLMHRAKTISYFGRTCFSSRGSPGWLLGMVNVLVANKTWSLPADYDSSMVVLRKTIFCDARPCLNFRPRNQQKLHGLLGHCRTNLLTQQTFLNEHNVTNPLYNFNRPKDDYGWFVLRHSNSIRQDPIKIILLNLITQIKLKKAYLSLFFFFQQILLLDSIPFECINPICLRN